MYIAFVTVTILAAAATAFAAAIDVVRADWVRNNMRNYGVPEWSLYPLAAIKVIGALGLMIGLAVEPLGLAAAIGLVVYFLGAVITVVRAGWTAQIAYPLPYLVLAAGSLALFVAA